MYVCVTEGGQVQVFVMNPNKSCLPPEPAAALAWLIDQKEKRQREAAVLYAWSTFTLSCHSNVKNLWGIP